ncbi:hypothetical protein SAMN04490247_3030 [Salimicrobium halophilum]|uniref:Uncharacterized protein n=1 Tax=Salimicrobium halophilum TaxID=86666 RepID=A0A1G8W524_9BACI|nr:hypothetical protein SAMN04490247_3030 [Salimicrobium halophilum]
MRSFVLPILKIAVEFLDSKEDEPQFSIKCLSCGCTRELEGRFSKKSGDIEVFNDEDITNNEDIVISIYCDKCGNSVDSAGY